MHIQYIIFDLITIRYSILIENIDTHIIVIHKIIIQLFRLEMVSLFINEHFLTFFFLLLYLLTIWLFILQFIKDAKLTKTSISWIRLFFLTLLVTHCLFQYERNIELIAETLLMLLLLIEVVSKWSRVMSVL